MSGFWKRPGYAKISSYSNDDDTLPNLRNTIICSIDKFELNIISNAYIRKLADISQLCQVFFPANKWFDIKARISKA